jgi:hypothetical protein
LFCSLADWTCNITDILTDHRFDQLDLEDELGGEIVARFYTRFLLVASELFVDLEQLGMDARQDNDRQRARQFLSPNHDETWLHNLQHPHTDYADLSHDRLPCRWQSGAPGVAVAAASV